MSSGHNSESLVMQPNATTILVRRRGVSINCVFDAVRFLIFGIIALGVLQCGNLRAAVVLGFNSDPVDSVAASQIAAGITPDALIGGSGISRAGTSDFRWQGWNSTNASYADAINDDEYWRFGFSVDTGFSVDLSTVDFSLLRTTSGPDDFEMRASINGGVQISLVSFDFNGATNQQDFSVALGGLGTLNAGDNVQFEFAAFSSGSGGGNIRLVNLATSNDLVINGSVSAVAVPEPSTCILAVGLLAMFKLRRRRGFEI